MSELTREEVLKRAAAKQSFARADLSGLDLSNTLLEGLDFSRAELDGANLEGAKLRGANFRNASLREAFLKRVDLREANLEKADFEGANLEKADLSGANLNRVTLEGATLTDAVLRGARLTGAQLDSADLGKANLEQAILSHAELSECYLGGANLRGAELSNAILVSANLEEANLERAILSEAELTGASAPRANLAGAILLRANLSKARLVGANLQSADLRHANLTGADLEGATLDGAKFFGTTNTGAKWSSPAAEWIDNSSNGDGSRTVRGDDVEALLSGKLAGPGRTARYFGLGDVLRDASLEFGDGSSIEIESRFENCSIALGNGTDLVVGQAGILAHCRITGGGNITIHGQFFERESPGIRGPRTLVVSSTGALVGTVEQAAHATSFAFEPGCRLRMKILKARESTQTQEPSPAARSGADRESGTPQKALPIGETASAAEITPSREPPVPAREDNETRETAEATKATERSGTE